MNPTLTSLLYPGCTAKRIGHLMTWFNKDGKHPVDKSRAPGYDQLNPADVTAHVQRLSALGFDGVMPDMYPVGSASSNSLLLYIPATVAMGMQIMPCIDKAVYQKTANPEIAIRRYLLWIRANIPNLAMWNGKIVICYFAMPGDSAQMFKNIEKSPENFDMVFVYNMASLGQNTMYWGPEKDPSELDAYCKLNAGRTHQLHIAGLSAGFNDGVSIGGKQLSCWPPHGPARIGPTSAGACIETLQANAAVFNAHYGLANQPAFVHFPTLNDWDEGSALESKVDGTGGFLSPMPPPVTVTGITLTPAETTIVAGASQLFICIADLSDGATRLSLNPVLKCSDATLGTVTGSTVTALQQGGAAIITATAEGMTATATLTVTPPPVTTLRDEVWLDGKKLANVAPGHHVETLVEVESDGTLIKTDTNIDV